MAKKTKLNAGIYKEQAELIKKLTAENIKDMNIYQRRTAMSIEIMGQVERNGQNQVYPYIQLPDIQEVCIPMSNKYGIDVHFSKYPEGAFTEAIPYKDKYGKDKIQYVRHQFGKMILTNMDKTSEQIIIDGIDFTGANDDPSKAGGNGDTYGQRYGWMMALQIQNTDFDLDADSDVTSERNKEISNSKSPAMVEWKRVMQAIGNNPSVNGVAVGKKLNNLKFNASDVQRAIIKDINVFKDIK